MTTLAGGPARVQAHDDGMRVAMLPQQGAALRPLERVLRSSGAGTRRLTGGAGLAERLRKSGAGLVVVEIAADGTGLAQLAAAAAQRPRALVGAGPGGDDLLELRAFAAGADAWLDLSDPPWKLCLRLRALHRARPGSDDAATGGPGAMAQRGLLTLDTERRVVSWRGLPVAASDTEFRLMAALAERPGRVRSRAELLDAVWDGALDVTDRTIDSHIKRLRKKIRMHDPGFAAIRTLYGVGYSFEP